MLIFFLGHLLHRLRSCVSGWNIFAVTLIGLAVDVMCYLSQIYSLCFQQKMLLLQVPFQEDGWMFSAG
ncbi:hypothetical protein BVRB_7g160490 isoform A [Beta vulgaris subsp. vulgaris]|nr:hypothetical protein BVRB_7g160490 isoform A [Beta vulgaris subsp. vulgaris]